MFITERASGSRIKVSLTEAGSSGTIGYWLIPDGDAYVKLPIQRTYDVQRESPNYKTLWTHRGTESVDIVQSGDLLLPVWPVVLHWEKLADHFPWLKPLIHDQKEGLFDPGSDKMLGAIQTIQKYLFGHQWSFFVVPGGSSSGLFGCAGGETKLPSYWDEFVKELEGQVSHSPQHVTIDAKSVDRIGFVNSDGDCSKITPISALVASQVQGLGAFLGRFEDGPEWSNLSQAYDQGILNDPTDFRGVDEVILQSLFNPASYRAAELLVQGDPPEIEKYQRIIRWFASFAHKVGLDWFDPSSFVDGGADEINTTEELIDAVMDGRIFNPSQLKRIGNLRRLMGPVYVNAYYDQTGPKGEEAVVKLLYMAKKAGDDDRDFDWLRLVRYTAWNDRDKVWKPSSVVVGKLDQNSLRGNEALVVGRLIRHLKNGGSATIQRPGINMETFLYRGPKAILAPDGSEVNIPLEIAGGAEIKLYSQQQESSQQETDGDYLVEATLRRLMDLTRSNGRYRHGGLRRIGPARLGTWVYDPTIRGRHENSRFVIRGTPKLKWAPDGTAILRFRVKSRAERSTTGEWQIGSIFFRRQKKGIRYSVATSGEDWKTAFEAADVEVTCSCPDFKYRWHYALSQKKVAPKPIGPGDAPPVITNPGMNLSLCKHLHAVADLCSDPSFLKSTFSDQLFKKALNPDPPVSKTERTRRRNVVL